MKTQRETLKEQIIELELKLFYSNLLSNESIFKIKDIIDIKKSTLLNLD